MAHMRHIEMEANSIHIVINPVAGGGMAGKSIDRIRNTFVKQFRTTPKVHITRGKSDGFRIGDQLRQTSPKLVVAAGGDGTINELVNGLLRNGRDTSTMCEIGILNLGSGGDFAKGLGLPKSLTYQVELLVNSGAVSVDLGLVRYEDPDGQPRQRLFINEFQLGLGAKVVSLTSPRLKALGGTLAYAESTIKNGLTYRAREIDVSLANKTQFSGRFLGLVIANGTFCGGGMQLTPQANLQDGELDLLLIHNMSIPERLLQFTRIYSGTHMHSKLFTTATSTSFNIASDKVQVAEMDGELLHLKNCTVEILPSALRVKALPIVNC